MRSTKVPSERDFRVQSLLLWSRTPQPPVGSVRHRKYGNHQCPFDTCGCTAIGCKGTPSEFLLPTPASSDSYRDLCDPVRARRIAWRGGQAKPVRWPSASRIPLEGREDGRSARQPRYRDRYRRPDCYCAFTDCTGPSGTTRSRLRKCYRLRFRFAACSPSPGLIPFALLVHLRAACVHFCTPNMLRPPFALNNFVSVEDLDEDVLYQFDYRIGGPGFGM
jgi:hypothetical protein